MSKPKCEFEVGCYHREKCSFKAEPEHCMRVKDMRMEQKNKNRFKKGSTKTVVTGYPVTA